MKRGLLFLSICCLAFFSTTFANDKICTKEYFPVCGADGVTYGNKCMAGDIKILYQGKCDESSKVEPCTREYNPVCSIHGITYSNICMAQGAKIAHLGECEKVNNLSQNDLNFYNHIKDSLSSKYINQVDKSLTILKVKAGKYDEKQLNKVLDLLIKALENKIYKITSSYPLDIALPENVNNTYLTLSLLKLELMKMKK